MWRPVDTGRKVRNKNPLEQWAPTFLAPGTCFTEGHFSTYWAWGDCFGMIRAHCIYCALYFHDYYINSTSGHQALDLGGWGPCFRGLPAKKPGILIACSQEALGNKIWETSVSLLIDGYCFFFVNTSKARHIGCRGNKHMYRNLELVFRDHCPPTFRSSWMYRALQKMQALRCICLFIVYRFSDSDYNTFAVINWFF